MILKDEDGVRPRIKHYTPMSGRGRENIRKVSKFWKTRSRQALLATWESSRLTQENATSKKRKQSGYFLTQKLIM